MSAVLEHTPLEVEAEMQSDASLGSLVRPCLSQPIQLLQTPAIVVWTPMNKIGYSFNTKGSVFPLPTFSSLSQHKVGIYKH